MAVPENPGAGVNVNAPSPLQASAPVAGATVVTSSALIAFDSTSVTPANTPGTSIRSSVSSDVPYERLTTPSGASFTALTAMVTVAVVLMGRSIDRGADT